MLAERLLNGHNGRGRCAVAGALATISLAAFTGAASASSTHLNATQGSFCDLAKSYASSINPTSSLSGASAESTLKTAFQRLQSEEPTIIASAPSSIKPDITKLFTLDNKLFALLKKVNYNFVALEPDLKTLEADEASMKPSLTRVEAYLKGTCGIKAAS